MGAAQYDGEPSPQLAARLDHVVELWPQGLAPLVVVTGGKRPGDRFTEAEASAALPRAERGVPARRDRARGPGHDELRVAARRRRAARGRGLDDVLIVTDPYHALRSRLIAEEVGLTAHVSPTPTSVVTAASSRSASCEEAPACAIGRLIGFEPATGLSQRPAQPRYTAEPLRGEWCNWQHSRFWFCY